MSPKVGVQTYKLPDGPGGLGKDQPGRLALPATKSVVCGSTTLRSGPGPTKPIGWAGWTSPPIRSRTATSCARRSRMLKKKTSPTSCCWAWAAPVCVPDVLKVTFGKIPGFPELHVLDSTDPAQVKAFENEVNLAKTLFIVSSKSGTTLEPNIFKQYFFERVKQTIGADKAGSRFIAITDPGSKMQQVAEADHFRHIFPGLPSIGGRYSALSNFGVVPAAIMGLDLRPVSEPHAGNGRGLRSRRSRRSEPGSCARNHSGHRGAQRTRQGHHHRFTRDLRSGRVARAVAGRIHRQAGQGHCSHRPRRRRTARGLWQRSRVCLRAAGNRAGQGAGRQGRRTRSRRGIRWSASRLATFTIWARNSSAGKSPPPWPGPSSESTLSTNPTWKPAKSRPAISPMNTRRPVPCPRKNRFSKMAASNYLPIR